MKFDLFKWQEVEVGQPFACPDGRCHVRSSEPVTVYAIADGYEAIAGFGQEIIFQTSEPCEVRIEASAKKVRAFVFSPPLRSVDRSERRFTSLDRAAQESGTMAEIKKALRLHKLEQRELQSRFRLELDAERRHLDSLRTELVDTSSEEDGDGELVDPTEEADGD